MEDEAHEAYRYDAFISYRHADVDRRWAKWLHTALETYRVPRRLVKEQGVSARLGRIFRDEDEVPASPHLADEIEKALQASRFLIVVCSPRTPESLWVNREIERFRELGRGDRILALLIEGEPKDAFPRALVEIRKTISGPDGAPREVIEDTEPLAADVRPSRRESARFLRRAARLRLLSCLVGCRYDDLARRDERRRRGRWLSLFAASALVLGLIAGLWVRLEREKRAQVEHALLRARVMGLVNASAEAGRTRPMLGLLLAHAAARASPDRDPRVAQRLRDAIDESLETAAFRVGDGVSGAEFSPKGDRILATATEGASLWRPDGTREASFPSSWTLESAVFSPQGDRVLTASSDRTATLWSLDGKALATFGTSDPPLPPPGMPGSPEWTLAASMPRSFAAFSPRGDRVLTSWNGTSVRLWSVEGKPLTVLEGHEGRVERAEFSPQGDLVLTVSRNGPVRLWSDEGKVTAILEGHAGQVTDAVFSSQGDRILTSSEDGSARLWSLDGKEVAVLRADDAGAAMARFSPQGDRLLTVDWNAARIWSSDGRALAVLRGHEGGATVARFSPSGLQILTAGEDKTARLWSVDGRPIAVLLGHEGPVQTAAFSPEGDRAVTTSGDGTVRVWALDARGTFPARGAGASRAALSPEGDRIAGASSGGVRVWSIRGEEIANFEGHTRPVESVAFSPVGDRVATGSYDGTVRVWPLNGGEATVLVAPPDAWVIAHDPHPHAIVRSVGFSPRGDRVLCASGRVGAWALDGTPLGLVPKLDGVTMVVLDRAGERVLTALSDGTARLSAVDGRELAVFAGHEKGVQSAVLSPKEDAVLTASEDGTARLWALDGTARTVFRGHEGGVESAAFSPDGGRVVTASDDATVRVWTLDGKVDATLRGHGAGVASAVFFPDGQRILSASKDGTLRIWHVGWDALLAVAERRIDRSFTAEERERYAELLGDGSRRGGAP